MYKVLKRTCFPIVLQIRYFVLRRSRCRRRCGFLQVPIIIIITATVDNPSSSLTASLLLLTLL